MNGVRTWVQAFVSLLGSFYFYLFGEWDLLLMILAIFVAIDYITGLLAAGVEGALSSKEGFEGIIKKVFIFAMVAVATLLDMILTNKNIIRDATIFFYITNEFISIIENAGRVGLPIPPFIRNAVEVLKNKSKK